MNKIKLLLTKENYLKVKKMIDSTTLNNLKIIDTIEDKFETYDIILQYDRVDLLIIQLIQQMPSCIN
jgi:hypothetical protein